MTEAENKSSKNTFQIDTEDSPIQAVVDFLDLHLQNFPLAFKRMTSSEKIEAEDDISQQLCDYLQRRTYSIGIFMFHFQRKQVKSRRSSDFGVLTVEHNNPFELSREFFVIEAKRLPTPGKDSKTGKSRRTEYVKGNLGGIERYKKGHHGSGLMESAIIGYIQDANNCEYWQQEINKWINDLASTNTEVEICWESGDLLILEIDLKSGKRYSSKNTRIVNSKRDTIKLHHYLMELK